MKVSTKTRYGLRFMVDLAQCWGGGCVALKDVAERQGISKKYLEQVVAPLAEVGLLEIKRGNRGGYQLARAPEQITRAEVVSASEEGINLMDCLGCTGVCEREPECITRNVWGGMQRAITDYLESRTLADVIAP